MKIYLTVLTILVVLLLGVSCYSIYGYIALSEDYSDLNDQFIRFVGMVNLEEHSTQLQIDKLSRVKPVNKFYILLAPDSSDLPDSIPEKQEKYTDPNLNSSKNQAIPDSLKKEQNESPEWRAAGLQWCGSNICSITTGN